jgi:hypothetical protein
VDRHRESGDVLVEIDGQDVGEARVIGDGDLMLLA